LHQLGAEDAVLESGVVLDVARDHELAAEREPLDDQRVQICPRRVERGRVTRRAASDDDDLPNLFHVHSVVRFHDQLNGFERMDVPAGAPRAAAGVNNIPPSVARNTRMAGAVTWSRLRELSSFRTTNGLALTLNLGLDPSTASVLPDTQSTKINSLLDEGQRSAFAQRNELTHDQKAGLHSDFERVRSYLVDDLDRAGMRGIAVFAAGLDGFW